MNKVGNKSIKIDDHEIHFKYFLKQHLMFGNVLVGLFEVPTTEKDASQNVRAYDFNGNEIWRIPKDKYRPEFSYVDIKKVNKNLIAINFSTNQLCIEPKSGGILEEIQVR